LVPVTRRRRLRRVGDVLRRDAGAARLDERGKRGEAVRVADQIDEDIDAVRVCLA
jgi:hypothetical protein